MGIPEGYPISSAIPRSVNRQINPAAPAGNYSRVSRVRSGMKGRWFAWGAGLSLAACVGVVVLWRCSYRFAPNRAGGDVLNFTHHDPLWWLISARGRLTLCRQVGRDWGREFPGFDAAGFKYGGLRGPKGSLYNLVVPHWFVAALLLSTPAAWVLGSVR